MIVLLKNKTKMQVFSSLGEYQLLQYLVQHMNKETFEWSCYKESRKAVCNELNISPATVHRWLKGMENLRIISNPIRGTYVINEAFVNLLS